MAPRSTKDQTKDAPETPDEASKAAEAGLVANPERGGKATPHADHDRVTMASRAPDGTPAQSPDFEYIGDKEAVTAAAEKQLAEQAVSARDVALAGPGTDARGKGNEGSSEPDPAVAELKAAHDEAAEGAKERARTEVEEHHAGFGARS